MNYHSILFLYLADTLPVKYPTFYRDLEKILIGCNIDFGLLPGTRDVWARDYMPVQVRNDHFVQFVYQPDYLQTKKLKPTISDVDTICRDINVTTVRSGIVFDGGNLSIYQNTAVICDKIFAENPSRDNEQLAQELRDVLELEKLSFIPWDPQDYTGHADGMVRFLDERTVLINDYSSDPGFGAALRASLHHAGLQYMELPYCPDMSSDDSAKGLYLNYLQLDDTVIVPVFGLPEDNAAVKQIERVFPRYAIRTIDGNALAKDGGIVNCVSWNIRKATH